MTSLDEVLQRAEREQTGECVPLIADTRDRQGFETSALLHRPGGDAGPAKEAPWHRAAAMLFAMGAGTGEVARAFDKTPGYISQLLRAPWFQEKITTLQADYGGKDIMALMKGEAYASLMTLVDIRDDSEAPKAVRVTAARDILDRHLGKPTQRVEMEAEVKSADPVAEKERLERELKFLD